MMRRVVVATLIVLATLGSSIGVASAATGVDVASYQHPNGAPINWHQVRGAGHSFAYVKATEGTTYTNPYFAGDWSGIGGAGLLRGAYHYARPKLPMSSAVDQARYFVSRTGTMQGSADLPPMLDLEDTTTSLSAGQVVEWSRIWLAEVERLTGRRPIIYTGRWYWSGYLASSSGLFDYRLWISDYNGKSAPTHLIPNWSWTIWQYTSTGQVPGIIGNVDVNRYCCSDANLRALAGSGSNPAASNPFGSVDAATKASGQVTVRGWGIDPDTTGSVDVHVYANGQFKGSWRADKARSDIAAAYPGWGTNHGYELTFPATGDQNVCVYAINKGSGNANTRLGCKTVSGTAVGSIDHVRAVPGGVTVDGWAFDPDTADPVEVHVYANGVGRAVTAELTRDDVASAYGLSSSGTGFRAEVPAAPGRTEVCAYVLDQPSGAARHMGCRAVEVGGNPVGSLDVTASGPGGLTVAGWALDPDTASPVLVHLYDNGRFVGAVTADGARSDIGQAFPGYGPGHGFGFSIAEPRNGLHHVCAFAINTLAGTTNPPVGCRNVVVSGSPYGGLDVLAGTSGQVRVAGWAVDADAVASPIQVAVEIGGTPVATLTADRSRPDIGAAFPKAGPDRGFDELVAVAPGTHQVCVVALGTGVGPARRTLGCGPVTTT